MKIKELMGMGVVDLNANDVGKISDIDFDPISGKLTTISISLKKGMLSNEHTEISFDDIKSIGDYVLLKIEINTENEEDIVSDENPIKNIND
ncbi:MAG: PRC-barrel domain-containing protein [archaeon]|nr:PRC-barrel domain-containing protein [archaeon]